MSKYKVIVSREAADMLRQYVLFLANVDKSAAHKTREKLIDAFYSLQEMPSRFPFFNDPDLPKNKYHKMYVEKWYLVLYQIKDNTVYIDHILDCRQEYKWLIE